MSGIVSDGTPTTPMTANVSVRLLDGTGSYSTVADANGHWSMKLVPGTYTFSFAGSYPDETQFYSWASDPVTLTSDTIRDLVIPRRRQVLTLTHADGTPASGSVQLYCSSTGVSLSDKFAGTGKFEIWTVPVGTCSLTVAPTDGVTVYRELTMGPDTPDDISITADPGILVTGTVSDGTSRSLSSATVWTSGPGGVATTDADGHWSMRLAPNTYVFNYSNMSGSIGFNSRSQPTEVVSDTHVDLTVARRRQLIHLAYADGAPATAKVTVNCYNSTTSVSDEFSGSAAIEIWTVPDTSCGFGILPTDGVSMQVNDVTVALGSPDEFTYAVERGVLVRGTISDGVSGPMTVGSVYLNDQSTGRLLGAGLNSTGQWSVRVPAGTYSINFSTSRGGRIPNINMSGDTRVIKTDTVIDYSPARRKQTLHLLNADGTPASGRVGVSCSTQGPTTFIDDEFSGGGAIAIWTVPAGSCRLNVMPEMGIPVVHTLTMDPQTPADLTAYVNDTDLLLGPPADGDGVDASIEDAGPNGGDGNHDGVPDGLQANVTSLPAMGVPGTGGAYLTVAAPDSTKLVDVFTLDPNDATHIPVPPPAGARLPAGVVGFVLKNVPTGSDQKIRIYPGTTTGLTGYAKYNSATQSWSLLPAERVAITPTYVELTLTDGGIGDADGQANGSIADPGGPAIMDPRPSTWTIKGFARPVDMGSIINTVKGGSTVPLKFEVFQGDRELSDPASTVRTFDVHRIECASGQPEDPVTGTTSGNTALRYDAASGQFVQNWKVPNTPGGCYAATVVTLDGSAITATFKVK